MEGFASLLAGLALKGKHALDLVVLGLSTPLHDDETRSVIAVAEGNALRDPFLEATDRGPFLEAMHAPIIEPTDWMLDSVELTDLDLRFNPATGFPMCATGIDVACSPEGLADGDSSHCFT